MRIVDYLKNRQVTAVFTSLLHHRGSEDPTVSSLIDNWMQLRNLEVQGSTTRSRCAGSGSSSSGAPTMAPTSTRS